MVTFAESFGSLVACLRRQKFSGSVTGKLGDADWLVGLLPGLSRKTGLTDEWEPACQHFSYIPAASCQLPTANLYLLPTQHATIAAYTEAIQLNSLQEKDQHTGCGFFTFCKAFSVTCCRF